MQELKYQKVYVPIILFIDENGKKTPKKIKWIDGNKYTIEKIIETCKAASTKVGGCGTRYTICLCGKETYLFEEDGRWFMEAPMNYCLC